MDASVIKNEWLAELLMGQRSTIAKRWIEEIRAEHISGYDSITDEQLMDNLPSTVDSMISAFRQAIQKVRVNTPCT